MVVAACLLIASSLAALVVYWRRGGGEASSPGIRGVKLLLEGEDLEDKVRAYLKSLRSVEALLGVRVDQVWFKVEQYSLRYPSDLFPGDVAEDVASSPGYVDLLVSECSRDNRSIVFHFHGPQLIWTRARYGARIYSNHPEFEWVIKGGFAYANISSPSVLEYYEAVASEVVEKYARSGDVLFFDTVQLKYYEYARLRGEDCSFDEALRVEERFIKALRDAIRAAAQRSGKRVYVSFLVHYLTVAQDDVYPWETPGLEELEAGRDQLYANYSDVIVAELVAEKAKELLDRNLVEKYVNHLKALARGKDIIIHLSVSGRPTKLTRDEYLTLAKTLKSMGVKGIVVSYFNPSDDSIYALEP